MLKRSDTRKKRGFISTLGARLRARPRYFNATIGGFLKSALLGGQFFDRLFKYTGQMKSTSRLSTQEKLAVGTYFQHREKAETTWAAATSWYGGDYFEFGALDLFTFRNMLSAFDICALQSRFPDTRFYAFDIFGRQFSDNPETKRAMEDFEARTSYFAQNSPNGDVYQDHLDFVKQHGLFTQQCFLIQGFFQDTLSPKFKQQYRVEGRKIGYAFIDCNYIEHYQTVFEFIYDLMADNSYIYMDEYFQSGAVMTSFEQFRKTLRDNRGIEAVFVRSAAGFGALFRLYPVADVPALKLPAA